MDMLHTPDATLPVAETFYSLQGEGIYSGTAAFFIRLAGCSNRCKWCDSPQTWNASAIVPTPISLIAAQAQQSGACIAIVTGGEPLLHNLSALCRILAQKGLSTHLETSGTSPLSGQWNYIALSPKQHTPPLPDIFPYLSELKVVISDIGDFEWAEQNAALCSATAHRLLQPQWQRSAEMLPAIIGYIKAHPQWRLSLQTHKFVDIQ
jgi:organic radical activating enzyme